MKKKVINGWVSRSCATPGGILRWFGGGKSASLFTGDWDVFKLKGTAKDWGGEKPKKVVITIEMED